MSEQDNQRVQELFLAALEISAEQRDVWLAEHCGDNEHLLLEVRALLQHDELDDDPLEKDLEQALGVMPAHTLDRTDQPFDAEGNPLAQPGPSKSRSMVENPGSIVDRYKLLQQIGEGGFGVVYMAEQQQPVKRRVALKIIKAGMDTKAVIARFEAERQALAMMDHPNIAKVLDAGATDAGRPYFVMELVKGIPITQYCDQANLDTRQRLELFKDVCSAVQHAHQKGIIHRDLKPSNILVTMRDDKPIVKVIDFGIAKATDQKLTEKTLFTQFGQMIGTPTYMSPEQAVISELDVDTRSDVYSLGVLLYELLTGSPPFDAQTLRSAGYDEMRRIIREQAPPKPSTRLSTLAEDVRQSVAVKRHVSPVALCRQLSGDLDWIIMKALEKERGRRYESASAFAQDIERHLNAEPVIAAAPSMGYKLRKFVRRNRSQVFAASVVFAALLLGIVGTTWGMIEARKQQRLAEIAAGQERQAKSLEAERAEGERLAKLDADEKRQAAEQARAEADKARQEAEQVTEFLVKAFRSPDPLVAGDKVTIVQVLGSAVERLEKEFVDQPLFHARLLNAIGRSYVGIGQYDEAVPVFETALALRKQHLEPHHSDTIASLNNLAVAYQHAGRLDEAVSLYEETVELSKARRGPEHRSTLVTMSNLADALRVTGRFDEAVSLSIQTFNLAKATLGPEHRDTLKYMNNLSEAYAVAGRDEEALPLIEEALRLKRVKFGPDHPSTLTSLNNLASSYHRVGRRDDALPLLEESLRLHKARFGPEHPSTLTSMHNLAVVYSDAGRLDDAVPLLEATLGLRRAKLGREHPLTLTTMNALAVAYKMAGRLDEAVPLHEETFGLRTTKLGPEHPETLRSMHNLAAAYRAAGRPDEVVQLYEGMLKLQETTLGRAHPQRATSLAMLGLALLETESFAKAEPIFRECLAIREEAVPDHWLLFNTQSMLGGALLGQKKYAEAVPLLLAGYEGMQRREESIPPAAKIRLAEALERLVALYEQRDVDGDADKAAKYRNLLKERQDETR